MKSLNLSSIAALFAGGLIALLPLNSFIEELFGVAIAFIALNAATYFIKGVQK
jgi:hypothetical protein